MINREFELLENRQERIKCRITALNKVKELVYKRIENFDDNVGDGIFDSIENNIIMNRPFGSFYNVEKTTILNLFESYK
jgi:uncharacterized protein Yka (UPF0111/DUF47 family)